MIIEVTQSGRHRKEYHRFDSPTVTVGRGYGNDLILSDPSVSAEHAIIREEGQGWAVEDLGSENGIFFKGRPNAGGTVYCCSGEGFTIGRTRLFLYSPTHPVSPPWRLDRRGRITGQKGRPVFLAVAILALLGSWASSLYLESWDRQVPAELASQLIVILLGLLVWAGNWAWVGRLMRHRIAFSTHMGISALFVAALPPLFEGSEWLGFITGSSMAERVITIVVCGSLFSLLLSRHLAEATHFSPRKRAITAAAVSLALVVTLTVFGVASRDEFLPTPRYSTTLKPPIFAVGRVGTIDSFIEKSGEIFTHDKD